MKKLTFNFPHVHCLVSFKEMYSIFWKNPEYEVFRSLHELEKPESFNGYEMSYDDAPWESSDSPLLYRHIIAEQLYKKEEKWAEDFPHDYFHVGLLLRLTKLWMNPLKWQWRIDWDDDFKDMVIEGRVAKEVYCSERENQVRKMLNDYHKQYVLDFANEFPICEEDDPQHGKIKGLHYWTMITWNNDPLFERILDGNECNEGELANTKSYDAAYLRKNLAIIAEKCGGERARYLLLKLQQEWKQIKIWRSDSEVMTERDMRLFEESIYHGFDDLLAEWEEQSSQTTTSTQKETLSYAFVTQTAHSQEIIDKISSYQEGKTSPKDVMMPIRAAMDAGVIRRPTYKELKLALPNGCPTKTSVSDYTNPDNTPYYDDAYKNMVETFRNIGK